ncbi:MAG: hypothetical protein R3B09_23585 [Nannocystaceae bacterium]
MRRLLLVWSLGPAACVGGSRTTATEGSSDGASTSDDATSSIGTSSSTDATSTGATSIPTTSSTAGETSAATSSTSDGVCPTPETFLCDPWAQDDCCEGEKCNPWANDGGGSWNADRCVPVVREPDAIGEPCHVLESGVSGLDTCEKGAMCGWIDVETKIGTCVALCHGSDEQCARDPASCCADGYSCIIQAGGWLARCEYECDPLVQDCPYRGTACYPGFGFFCYPDHSGDAGSIGDPCDFANECEAGAYCDDPAVFPGCDAMAVGCCVPFCSLDAPECPPETACLPFYDPDEAPAGTEDVGACVIPP